MTIAEAKSQYGVLTYLTNKGDTLMKVVDNIYESRDALYFYILSSLNPSVNWCPVDSSGESTGMDANVEVYYLDKSICSSIYEITG